MPAHPVLVLAAARAWVGTPTVPGASLRGHGADCAGLVRGVIRDVAGRRIAAGPIPAPGIPRTRALLAAARAHLLPPRAADPEPGDVVAVRAGGAAHLGIWVGPGLIHACDRTGRVVETSGDFGRAVLWARPIPAATTAAGVRCGAVRAPSDILAVVHPAGRADFQSVLDAAPLGWTEVASRLQPPALAAVEYLAPWGIEVEVI